MSSWIFFYCAWIYVGFRENGGESKTSNIYWLFCLNIGEIPIIALLFLLITPMLHSHIMVLLINPFYQFCNKPGQILPVTNTKLDSCESSIKILTQNINIIFRSCLIIMQTLEKSYSTYLK